MMLRLTAMGLSVNRLSEWLAAILQRIETTHPETNANLMWAIGAVMCFPSFLAPDNDDQPDGLRPADHPGGAES